MSRTNFDQNFAKRVGRDSGSCRLSSIMKSLVIAVSFLAVSLSAQPLPCAPRWAYCGYNGPQHWASIDSRWSACDGSRQSPVELRWSEAGAGETVKLFYNDARVRVENNGYEIRATPIESAGYIEIGSDKADLVQFHLHTPSEHGIAGEKYPAELHLVHQVRGKRELFAIGVLMTVGGGNSGLEPFLSSLPSRLCSSGGERRIPFTQIFARTELKEYLTYPGSLTTPACDENVTWYLPLDTDITLTEDQLKRLVAIGENARPPQSLGTRTIKLVRNP